MATVRITSDIRNYVVSKINALFEDRVKREEAKLQHLDIANQVFMSLVSAQELEMAKRLNLDNRWIPEISMLSVIVEYKFEGQSKVAAFSVPFKPPVPAPVSFQGYGPVSRKMKPTLPCYQHAADVLITMETIRKERDTLTQAISKVMQQCTTLRQVLDVWPTAMDYMPEGAKKRHAEKSKKRGSTVIDEVDDAAKMLLMKARMINGV